MTANETDCPLVGVCLCSETNLNNHSQVIGTVHVPQESHSQTLIQFRNVVTLVLPQTLGRKSFCFLTPHGWEINEKLENIIKLSSVLTKERTVNIRLTYSKPRFGIVIEGSPNISVGFIFCDLTSTVTEVVHEIETQLPSLHTSLSTRKFYFLDRNSWPVHKEQESLISLMEVSNAGVIKIRCSSLNSYSRKISIDDKKNTDFPDQPISDSFLPVLHPGGAKSRAVLSPINEFEDHADPKWPSSDYTELKAPTTDMDSFEILLSYVHTEAGTYALFLKQALEDLGYSVFLDIHCIEGGKDWQDVLNHSITNCHLFVPLITMQYGQTLWTNREVKLADVLGKLIMPVNFNQIWPPKCLAIQFATTQYIPGNKSALDKIVTQESFTEDDASILAEAITDQYRKELETSSKMDIDVIKVIEPEAPVSLSRQNTDILESPSTPGLMLPVDYNALRRKSAIKSYGSDLPESIPKKYRMSVFEPRKGKPLIVISCCKTQREYAQELISELEEKDYEVWCSCDIDHKKDEEKSSLFQKNVSEAGAVIFILSKEFAEDTFCEQQVYYCEQRKRIIPLVHEPHAMPNWMSTLIGTSTFISCQSKNYMETILDRIQAVLNPQQAGNELKKMIEQKVEISEMCSKLENRLPKGKHVYISGGTMFFSKCGESICKEIGRQLAKDDEIVLVTGGFYGVGETVGRSFFEERKSTNKPHGICHIVAIRDEQDRTNQTRQNADRTFPAVPYGDTLKFGNSIRQREMLTPRVVDLCILVEGGPGAAFEAQQFVWNGNQVIPIQVTGGAAGGSFNVPPCIRVRPPNVPESDWSILSDESASPSEIASAVGRIVKKLKNSEIGAPGIRSRSNSTRKRTHSNSSSNKIKRGNDRFKRSDTAPSDASVKEEDTSRQTLEAVKRTLSQTC